MNNLRVLLAKSEPKVRDFPGSRIILFIIYFDMQQVYHPGETIKGALEFTLKRSIDCNMCIKVSFSGVIRVRVKDEHHCKENAYVQAKHKVVQESITLWNNRPTDDRIEPGYCCFDFQFVVPTFAPPTFKLWTLYGCHGTIAYDIVGHVATGQLLFDRKSSAVPIIIEKPTSCSGAFQRRPVCEVRNRLVDCIFCSVGEVEYVTRLSHTGYCVCL